MEENEKRYKIVHLDKEYKKNNKKLITAAIFNASVLALMTLVVIKQDSNLPTTDINSLITTLEEMINNINLPFFDSVKACYAALFDGIRKIMDELGVLGVLLASKAVNFAIKITKGTIKSLKIKNELKQLQSIKEKEAGGKENAR